MARPKERMGDKMKRIILPIILAVIFVVTLFFAAPTTATQVNETGYGYGYGYSYGGR